MRFLLVLLMAEVGKVLVSDNSSETKKAPDVVIVASPDKMEATPVATETEQSSAEIPESTDSKKLLQPVPASVSEEVVVASEKAPKVPETGTVLTLQSGTEGSSSPFIREKVMEDGYNWRKYGQKLVKGNEFVRSYYRCTHPNCKAKKQLERSPGGQIVDTVYFGEHDHPKPLGGGGAATHQPPKVHGGLHLSVVPMADEVKTDVSPSSRIKSDITHKDNVSPASKRRKKGGSIEQIPMERPNNESRNVVHTQTLFDIVNDGYRWRKYGQKSVKGSPYPSGKDPEVNKTPQSSALITKEEHHLKKKAKSNGLEKSLDQGPVLDAKPMEEIKERSEVTKDQAAKTKSDANTSRTMESEEEQKPKEESGQS
ncbi:hypothetical protein HID58_011794 [Brassica napus]|uniref:WRKY domain-containing protein n=1 Tax=Brassica napus TaxID=3708 RepID=A0ABQ8DZ76_BRANA|nr:hypothetical protein HID58_011794 [Brassica napus]